jgi:hypothetical protein
MDTPKTDRDAVKLVIQKYARFKPSHGDVRFDTVLMRPMTVMR